ncbi:alpha/beta hydrolase [Pseudoteredinibacter isoporae]|uniref:Pimeloyl-ACP methyl ester carboxylesterase n=1 Tax=Pseudoteredinibacter isoporae TaxID=570281 RepID=A0A7X0MU05_9GAMM|nr:alpha/beta hydrolase [Pseudoteredinibacter isoporae]MBB6519753.1 pimeloyl-ACP methyl ester carboxylesterase [Pseudoteredinibacter isoporae]NHO85334.1 alpha/beta fold hydrolase [Pseudoteredinibacter isoporae]NIB26214.1 alpha/beta fold hydrolase [Pseudoteredinibacter isoporae]
MHSLFATLMLALVLAPPMSWAESEKEAAQEGELSPCYLPNLSDQVSCGSVEVPELSGAGKNIDVHFAVLPALRDKYPEEAVLVIAGGPGQSAMDLAGHFNRLLNKVRRERDILIIDQRGTGRSNKLHCDQMDSIEQLSFDDQSLDIEKETRNCKDELGADLNGYNSRAALEDFETIRKKLAYKKLHLFGTSYGTRMVQLYMRHYPESVASGIMDGLVPLQQNVLAVGESVDHAMELLLSQCETQPACQQRYPNLRQDFQDLLSNIGGQTLLQGVKHPVSAEGAALRLTRSKLNGVLRLALYSQQARSLLPYAIDRLKLGDSGPILGLFGMTLSGFELAMGMHAAIVCAEDWPRLTDEDRAQMKGSLIGEDMLAALDIACPVWNVAPNLSDFEKPLVSDIPSLLLSGKYDPATPPAWASTMESQLGNSLHVVFPNATHSVAGHTCANELIAEFIAEPNPDEVDLSCVEKDKERGFFLNANSAAADLAEETEESMDDD